MHQLFSFCVLNLSNSRLFIINFCDAISHCRIHKLKRIEHYLLAAIKKICAKVALLLNAFSHLIVIFILCQRTKRTDKNWRFCWCYFSYHSENSYLKFINHSHFNYSIWAIRSDLNAYFCFDLAMQPNLCTEFPNIAVRVKWIQLIFIGGDSWSNPNISNFIFLTKSNARNQSQINSKRFSKHILLRFVLLILSISYIWHRMNLAVKQFWADP